MKELAERAARRHGGGDSKTIYKRSMENVATAFWQGNAEMAHGCMTPSGSAGLRGRPPGAGGEAANAKRGLTKTGKQTFRPRKIKFTTGGLNEPRALFGRFLRQGKRQKIYSKDWNIKR
eukprot:Lithocolla_globosa_v1_NODE_4183_length_1492_cov_72.916493.p1 type:complete len:119 gc:universal NODE_4183_length_1492_cov_72.916493:565-921(+)